MRTYDEPFETIREAQITLLDDILHNGELVEDTIEVDNVVLEITDPMKYSGNLMETLTKTGQKFYDQMMLQPDPKLEKTHYCRLHDWKEYTGDDSMMSLYFTHYDQVDSIVEKLKEKPESRRCMLTLWKPQDITDPYALCWTFAQVLIRGKKLVMTVHFRSNDIFNAFPFNMLGIAILQGNIAELVGIKCGELNVVIGSAHVYNKNIDAAYKLIETIET